MTGLYNVDVSVLEEPDDDPCHVEISLSWAGTDFEDCTDEEHRVAANYVAGLLARVACEAMRWVALEQQEHGCASVRYTMHQGDVWQDWQPSCTLGAHGLLDASEPMVAFCVPTAQRRVWLERIRTWLEALALAQTAPALEESQP